MPYQLSIHERAAIERAFRLHHGRDLALVPELVEVEEDDTVNRDAQAFNRDFTLWFTSEPLANISLKSVVCDVLPDNVGPALYLTVEAVSLKLLLARTISLPAASIASYRPYIAMIQPWVRQCLAIAAGSGTHQVFAAAWEKLLGCASDFSRFDMLRLMIIGDRICFFGQTGAAASVRAMGKVRMFQEPDRLLSIRTDGGHAVAIDGFAHIPVTHTGNVIAWTQRGD